MSVVCLSAWNSSRSTPDQGTTIVIDLWTTPDRLVMTDDRLATCARPSRVLTNDGEQDKTDIRVWRPTCDQLVTVSTVFTSLQPSWAPDRINRGVSIEESSAWVTWLVTTRKSILCHSQVTRESLFKLLCPSYVTRQKLPLWRNFKSNLRLTYVRAEWHTSPRLTYDQFVRDLQPTYEPAPSWPLGKSFPTVLNRSIRSGNLCRAMASPPELLRVFRSNLRPSDK